MVWYVCGVHGVGAGSLQCASVDVDGTGTYTVIMDTNACSSTKTTINAVTTMH